jgi:hypothetical protein
LIVSALLNLLGENALTELLGLPRVTMSEHVGIPLTKSRTVSLFASSSKAYAHCADRDTKGQMSLFTADTRFVVYMNAKGPTPS